MEFNLQHGVSAHDARVKTRIRGLPSSNPEGFVLGIAFSTLLGFVYYLMKRNGGHPIGMSVRCNRNAAAALLFFQ
jgi:hypothetical protein